MIRVFLIAFSAVAASIPIEEATPVPVHSGAETTQQNRRDSAQAPGAIDSAGRGGRRGGGAASRNDGTVRTDVEATPGSVGGGASSWLRIFGYMLLGLAAISAAAVGLRKLVGRVSSKRRQVDELPLVFPVSNHEWQVVNRFPNPTNHTRPAPPSMPVAPAAPAPAVAANNNSNQQHATVRVPKPSEGTLQLLPGRFEVASGNDRMKEIRFIRTSGPPVITFGRHAGDAPTHVQVDSPTVSRMHASMRFDSGRWHIRNLSGTNPLLVNGEPLPANGTEQMLNDGDQVEMGEMVFRFRAR